MGRMGERLVRVSDSFPSVSIPSRTGGVPVEITLIAQVGHGAGSQMVRQVAVRQRGHAAFVDALDEPSARLGGMDVGRGDHTSLYSFVVGADGHPFHRHAGHRMFTAVSGSSGAQLRFSTATLDEVEQAPGSFPQSLHLVEVPPDCMFTVRFGGGTWHQFAPLVSPSRQPAFFAISCHTDELGGLEAGSEIRQRVIADMASIPALTEVLPKPAQLAAAAALDQPEELRRTSLSLQAPAGHWQNMLCQAARMRAATLRALNGRRASQGFASIDVPSARLEILPTAADCALLCSHFSPARIDHDDTFRLVVRDDGLHCRGAVRLLDELLQAFVDHPPKGVTGLMLLRNALVRPFGLRRSRLGCPVSSLGSAGTGELFAGRHRVLAQSIDASDTEAQVLLGADDRHLRFRTCVGVRVLGPGEVAFSLANRVSCNNAFGRFYMEAIDRLHRRYVAPTMLRSAVANVLQASTR